MTDAPLYRQEFRVAMGDTDAAQLIYFGAPTRWAERLVTGYLHEIGIPTSAMLAAGYGLPAVELRVSYRSPLRLDDPVRGELRVRARSERSITWRCDLFRGQADTAAVEVALTQVSVRIADGTPVAVALPERLAAATAAASTHREDR